jgi:transposase
MKTMIIASADTRRRALAAYEQGVKTQEEIAALFGVTLRTFQRWWRAWQKEGRDAPGRSSGRPMIFVGAAAERLRQQVKDTPDATLHELMERVGNIAVCSTVHRTLGRLKLPYKKRRSAPPSKTGPT